MNIVNPFLIVIALIQLLASTYYFIIKEPVLAGVQLCACGANIFMAFVRG